MTNKSYVPVIDGLRAVAVLLVFMFHLKLPGFKGGFIGVDIFFVISGYLITSIFFNEINLNSKFNFFEYLRKRIYRLFPALIFVIFFTIVTGLLLMSPLDLIQISKSSIFSLLFLSNIYYFLESSYWANLNEYKIFIHTWSLGIEMSFYILMPIFLYFIIKFNTTGRILLSFFFIITSLVVISFLISKGPTIESVILNKTFYGKEVSDILFYLIPFRFFEFLFGSILFFLPKKKVNETYKQFFFILGFLLILIALFLLSPNNTYQSLIVCIALVGSCLIIYFRDAYLVNKIINNKIAIFLGLISYSLYLVHWPVITFFKYIFINEILLTQKILIVAISILLSFLIYKFIEIPFRNKNFFPRLYLLIIFGFSTLIISNTIIINKGFIDRLNEDQKKILYNITNLQDPCNRIDSKIFKLKSKICLYGNEKKANILLLGDSNATTWFPITEQLAKKNNTSVVNYSRICNSFPKHPIIECNEINSNSKILVIGNLWYNWQSKEENIQKDILSYIENINSIKKNKNFKNIEKIIIFGQIPALKNNQLSIMSCLLKPKLSIFKQNCEKIYSHFEDSENNLEKYKKVNYYLNFYGDKIISENYEFLFIDPIDALCIDKNCIQYKKNELFYINNNHLSVAGANFVFEKNKKELQNFIQKN